ncbi:family 20 glycosylhydrolase (plasmid) [Photobacterium sp. DA100]|uniref:family 20 glycosylhydrolase n=1 Tax=Photobacterium sp. DA100 TaxID=3027472 RepID=UPI0024786A60|nr:family 20 glycosylhydrolase [Photobacterium sp. DA100]WEM44522.1 family 20 glycosylhydrolase [Photobacterium sp. DA100]
MHLDLKHHLIANDDAGSRLSVTLSNQSDSPLEDWHLEFSCIRGITSNSLTCGSLEQVGTLYRLTPPEHSRVLMPGQQFYAEFEVPLPHITLQGHGITEAAVVAQQLMHRVNMTPLQFSGGMPFRKQGVESDLDVETNVGQTAAIAIIPQPAQLMLQPGTFTLDSRCQIERGTALAQTASQWLEEELRQRHRLVLAQSCGPIRSGVIRFQLDNKCCEGSYQLDVRAGRIQIQAGEERGFFSAVASLLQLIPLQAEGRESFLLPAVAIQDTPRFGYRGMMLDCVRHFHPVSKVKQIINQLARLKFNVFHWHLTDDEGWRIEIKAFPALTDVGAWRGPNTQLPAQFGRLTERYGGYYSQQDIREMVAYAAARGITVIPEIDIPGHSRAAIKALPELLFDDQDQSQYTSVQHFNDNVLSPGLDGTYTFLRTVLDEVCELFPAPFVHIGADEVPEGVWSKSPCCQRLMSKLGYSDPKELQGHLLRFVEQYLAHKGRRMLGWEEVVHGDKVSSETVVFSWQSEKAALECLEKGHDVVLQPGRALYLDMVQSNCVEEPGLNWAGILPLEKVYHYDPLANVPLDKQNRVLGIQAALWCETVTDEQTLDYMLYPRLFAAAEVAWSESRQWYHFRSKLKNHLAELDILDIVYCRSDIDDGKYRLAS